MEKLRHPEGFLLAGWPRYHTLFGRDSLIAAWQSLEHDPSIAAATLRVLARHQGRRTHAPSEEEPGKILHEHRFDAASRAELPEWEFPYYGSVDSTPLFLILAEAYRQATDDEASLVELAGAFDRAWQWIVRFGDADGDGLVEYERKNPRGLFHQGWKDGSGDHLGITPPVAIIEAQGYAMAAHRAYASLSARLGHPHLAKEATKHAEDLREKLDPAFWIPNARYFALGLDGAKRPRTAITSNPGHLLLSAAVSPYRAGHVIDRVFQEDMWTPYGVRTHSMLEPDFDTFGYHTGTVWPHDNWFLYRGLRAMGKEAEAAQVRDALLAVHETLGRIPELYAVRDGELVDLSQRPVGGTRANPVQAWASAGLLDMLRDA